LKLPIVNGATVGVADERDRLDRVEARMEAMERLMRRERGEKKEDLAMMVSGLFLEMEKMKKERESTAQKMEEMTRSIREVEYMTEIIRTEPTNSFIQIPYERREQHEFESSLQIR
jgi:thymidine phosphorylase